MVFVLWSWPNRTPLKYRCPIKTCNQIMLAYLSPFCNRRYQFVVHSEYSLWWMLTQVFTRERLNGHYGVGAFVIGNTLSSIPFLFLTAFVSTSIFYFMVGLHPGIECFVYFVLSLFACLLVVESLMMAVAALVPNYLMGIITGAGIQVWTKN